MTRRVVARTIVAQIVATVVLVFAVLYMGYQGREAFVVYQRAGCERGKLDRADNARSWRASATADLIVSKDPNQPEQTRRARALSAAVHDRTATDLERRARIDCAKVFPPARLFAL